MQYLQTPPVVSDSVVIDGYVGPWRYNHDSAIASLNGRLYVLWNATQDGQEGGANQVILQSTSDDDGLTWSDAVAAFSDPQYCLSPVSATGCQQWQPSMIAHDGKIICLWDKTGSSSGLYLSVLDPAVGKWTADEIGAGLLPFAHGSYSVTRLATQTAIYALASGRLFCPVIAQAEISAFATDPKWMVGLYSDDKGATWKLGTPAGSAGEVAGAWEPYITERQGVLTAYIRRLTSAGTDGRVRQYVCTSVDGGEHWSVPQTSGWDIASSRGASVPLGDGRWAVIHNTITSISTANPRDRRALSVWLGDGGPAIAPAFCISGVARGIAWSYPAACMHKGRLAIVSSRAQLGDGSVRQVGVTLCDLPAGYAYSPAGQSVMLLTPTLSEGVLSFTGGETRFAYTGSVAALGGVAASVCIAGRMTHRWGRSATSSPDGTWYLFDSRSGVAGFAVRIGGAVAGENSNLIYFEYYSGGPLLSVGTSLRLPNSGKWTLILTLSGTALAATLITEDGAVATDSKTLSAVTSYAALSPSFGCANQGTWQGFIGDIAAASYYDSALTTAQARQWHTTYGERYGLPAWSGGTAALPVSGAVLLDPQGSLASWPTPGVAPAKYTLAGRELTASGLYSLPIPTPLDYDGEVSFRYRAMAGRANAAPICTVGTAGGYFTLYKSAAASDTVYYLSSVDDTGSFIGRALKSVQDVAIADGEWFNVTIRFQGRYVTILHDKMAPFKTELPERPQVFLGWGWRYDARTASIATDAMVFDVDSVAYREQPSANEGDLSNTWIAWTPVLNVGGSSSGITTSTATGRYRISDGRIFGTGEITLTSKGAGSGAVTVTGLPYPAQNTTGNRHEGVDVSVYSGMSLPAAVPVMGYLQSSVINLTYPTTTGQAALDASNITNSTVLRFSFWAFVQGA